MKSVRIHRFGGPEVLQVDDLPRPEPASGEVLIEIHAASVNPVDVMIRAGKFVGPDQLPVVLGRDASGTVSGGSSDFRQGEAVYVFLPQDRGGYAEFVAVPADIVAPKPERMDFTQAAAVPLAGITAWQGLFDHGGLKEGQRVLIHGAAGGVGHFAVQFAHARGATVIATAGARDIDFVRSLGAEQVIDYKAQRFEDIAREIDVVLDLIAGETQDRSWQVLKPGGIIVSTLSEPKQDMAAKFKARGTHFMAQPNGGQLREIGRLIDAGKVRAEVSAVFPLTEAAKAQAKLMDEHPRGKIVLRVRG